MKNWTVFTGHYTNLPEMSEVNCPIHQGSTKDSKATIVKLVVCLCTSRSWS